MRHLSPNRRMYRGRYTITLYRDWMDTQMYRIMKTFNNNINISFIPPHTPRLLLTLIISVGVKCDTCRQTADCTGTDTHTHCTGDEWTLQCVAIRKLLIVVIIIFLLYHLTPQVHYLHL